MRYRRWFSALLVVLVVLTALGIGAPHATAWYHLRAARGELARYHPELASAHLSKCLAVWPNSVDALMLASRAAWQDGDFETADRQLHAAQRLSDGNLNEIALEWALLHAASGDLRENEDFLQQQLRQDPQKGPLIWEAVASGYLRAYRAPDAMTCLNQWLAVDPNNVRALELRGQTLQSAKQGRKAADDLKRVLELDPTRSATRWRLVLCLLEAGSYNEALTYLEEVARERPDDPDVKVREARCHNFLGQSQRAVEILDRVLKDHPDHVLALRTRGQIALAEGHPEHAEIWLRKAAAIAPDDPSTQFLFYQALQNQNKTEEALAQRQIEKATRERAEQLGDLKTRRLFEQPLNPALHYEMGVLLLRRGQNSSGESWLLSALSLDPDYQPAHEALANYYRKQGDFVRAEDHRRKAERK